MGGLTPRALSKNLGSDLRPLRGSTEKPPRDLEPRAPAQERVGHPDAPGRKGRFVSFVHALQNVNVVEVTKQQSDFPLKGKKNLLGTALRKQWSQGSLGRRVQVGRGGGTSRRAGQTALALSLEECVHAGVCARSPSQGYRRNTPSPWYPVPQ